VFLGSVMCECSAFLDSVICGSVCFNFGQCNEWLKAIFVV